MVACGYVHADTNLAWFHRMTGHGSGVSRGGTAGGA